MATFVLVHGAWAGGWIWKKIIPVLRAAGHDVHATTATGLGDRVHLTDPAIDLDTHITDVVTSSLSRSLLTSHSSAGATAG